MGDPFMEYIKSEDALFHYTNMKKTKLILEGRRFKPSLKGSMTDPNEFIPKDIGWAVWGEVPGDDDSIRAMHQTAAVALSRIKSLTQEKSQIMCFCSNSRPYIDVPNEEPHGDSTVSDEGWAKSRMWIQYGDRHEGCCLVFSKEKLKGAIDRTTGRVESAFPPWDEAVWYIKGLKGHEPPEPNVIDRIGAEEYARGYMARNYHDIYFKKDIDFRDESEYRFVIVSPQGGIEYVDISDSIKGVIVGYKATAGQAASVAISCKELSIEVSRMTWESGFPWLEYLDQAPKGVSK